jgi:hypothetical protein
VANTPPTLVSTTSTAWDTTTTPKSTASISVQTGDILVVRGVTENSTFTLSTPTGGSLTYNLEQSSTASSNTATYLWTATASSTTSFAVSCASSGGGNYGISVNLWRGSDGVGLSSKTTGSGGPSLTYSTGTDNSAIDMIVGDWNAIDGTSRTYRTVNSITPVSGGSGEGAYNRMVSKYTIYSAYWTDAGALGSKTVGVSAPVGQAYTVLAVEIKGAAGASTYVRPTIVVPTAAVMRAGSW